MVDSMYSNADKIRSMSDEELAEFLTNQFCHSVGEELILKWLKMEAKPSVKKQAVVFM